MGLYGPDMACPDQTTTSDEDAFHAQRAPGFFQSHLFTL
jgi:hypothetical protein